MIAQVVFGICASLLVTFVLWMMWEVSAIADALDRIADAMEKEDSCEDS